MPVVAGTDDSAVIQHKDQIRVAQGADPLGDQNGGGIAVVLPQCLAKL